MAGDWKAMTEAAKNGQFSTVRMYVQNGNDINFQHPEYYVTPLMGSIFIRMTGQWS